MTTKIQMDTKMRVVAKSNLAAMCERVSGHCHTFCITRETMARITVEYSNPDEYGNPHPIRAEFPVFDGDKVVMYLARVIGGRDGDEQAFDQLLDCRPLFRANCMATDWETEYDILLKRNPTLAITSTWDKGGCVQTWHCVGVEFKSWQQAQDYVVAMQKIDHAAKINEAVTQSA